MKPTPVKLYDFLFSGASYKARLALSLLEIQVEYESIDLMTWETRSDYFVSKNPVAQIPVLELSDGTMLRESNAILTWLTEDTPLVPEDSVERAEVLQWMFFETSNIDKNLGRCRFMETYPDWKEMLPPGHLDMCVYLGGEALRILNEHLEEKQYLVGERYTSADISVFAYVHCSEEGGFNLDDYPNVKAWCERVKDRPRHIAIDFQPY